MERPFWKGFFDGLAMMPLWRFIRRLCENKDARRYRWLKANVRGGSFGLPDGWLTDDTSEWNAVIDGAMRER
jgi:hypothetical protein